MKLYLTKTIPGIIPGTSSGLLRPLCIATLAMALSACGGSNNNGDGTTTEGTTTDGTTTDGATTDGTTGVSNPDSIDVNMDGQFTDEDDWNFDNVVNQADVDAFNLDAGITPGDGGQTATGPDCTAVDCDSSNAEWSDNAQISRNQSPTSSYALGIQRILYCLNYGGTEDGTAIGTYADGIFGPNTAASVKTYQTDKKTEIDGVVGEKTWELLRSELQGPLNFDDEFNYWIVSSAREDCNAKILFYQRKGPPMDWQQAAEPGSTAKIPFSINPANPI